MTGNRFQKTSRVIAVFILVAGLVSVRIFQESLFYDPLIAFFKTENKILPEYNAFKLYINLAYRYTINALISLAIIYLIFKDKSILKVSGVLYFSLFVILMVVFYIVINKETVNLLQLFYVRRFLIQPLFLILFVPAFYYQKKLNKNNVGNSLNKK